MLRQWLRRMLHRQADPLGARGERAAARWLRRHGYRILDRNVLVGDDEADLIALDPDGCTVVIVEVKTRLGSHAAPEQAIDRAKQFHIARLASNLQKRTPYHRRPFRFDVIAVAWTTDGDPEIRHHPGAFEAPW